MPAKKPAAVRPLVMTLRSRSRSQDIQTAEESRPEVAKEKSKREVAKEKSKLGVAEEKSKLGVAEEKSKLGVAEEKSKLGVTEEKSKLGVAEEKLKRKVRKNLRQETVKEELNNNVVKEQPEEKVFREELKSPTTTRHVGRRKREGKEIDRDAKVAKIGERKKSVRSSKSKKWEAPEEPRTEVQKATLGSEEPDQIEKTVMENKAKRKTTTGRRQLRSDAMSVESQTDETLQETFSTEDWRVIEGIKGRAERLFDVIIVACLEKRSKAANITISGSNRETRLLCKEYLFALTRPGCTTVLPYPPERHSFLTEDAVHERLERDSQAYLVFRRIGEVEIYGLDSLSVALAMSSLESLLENHRAAVFDGVRPEKEHQKSSRRSSLLLDAELKNWMSSSEDGVYRNASDAVRHSILSVVKDESREIRMEAKKGVEGGATPRKVASSPALHSSALKLLSDAYMSVLEDSVAPLSPFAAEDNSLAPLGMESVRKNISKDPDFASCSVQLLQHKENMVVKANAVEKENDDSAVERETKKSEIANSFAVDRIRQEREKQGSETKAKQTESTHEYIASKDSKQKVKSIIVSSGSGSRTQKDRCDHSKTTPIDSNYADRKVYHHNDSGLSCEIKVPSGDRRPRQSHSSRRPGINSQDSGGTTQKDQHGRSKTTPTESNSSGRKVYLHNDSGLSCKIRVPSGSGSSNAKTRNVQGDANSSTKRPAVRSDSQKEVKLTQNSTAVSSNQVVPPVIYPLLSIVAQPPTSSLATGAGKLRYVVIDGSNVAMAHGKNQAFSCPGIEICIKYFLERGHPADQITAFVPQSRLCRPHASHKPIVGQHLLQKLANTGLVVFTPARKVPGRNIVCYDDRYVLRLAAHTNGIIVTNDNYRDLWMERNEWREIIENCLLPFSFVNDLFMPPDDPLGRNGPNLNQFLTDQHQPHLGRRNHNAAGAKCNYNANSHQTGGISTNAKLFSVNQWYKNR